MIGDFTSNYLAVLHGVDPTPVKTINYLKDTLKENGFKEKIIGELAKLKLIEGLSYEFCEFFFSSFK